MAADTETPVDGRSFAAAQSFVLGAKLFWTREMFPALRADFDGKAEAKGVSPETPEEVAELIGDTTLYRYFAWLERHLQRFKYSGRYGLHTYHVQDRAALEARLDPDSLPDGLLELDPDLDLPKYFTVVDIHQHPGGIWSDDIAGYVYERGARTTTPLSGMKHRDLHDRLVEAVEERGGVPGRLLDMGCGFGKSTEPFAERFRDSEVIGVDIAAPCLKLAARNAADGQRRNLRYLQRDAAKTGLEAESVDCVTSTMLLHEMPPKAIGAAFDEARRVLKPGGRMVHLDFWTLPDAFARFIHYGHSRRNNEPYMPPWAEMDVAAVLEEKGFTDIEVTPFEEADGALDPANTGWRFPWTLISAVRAG